jgi:tankyrase
VWLQLVFVVCFTEEMAAQAEEEGDGKLNLFEACKNGDLERVASLLSPESVNSRDVAGRKSTPIHFAAGTG